MMVCELYPTTWVKPFNRDPLVGVGGNRLRAIIFAMLFWNIDKIKLLNTSGQNIQKRGGAENHL